MRFATYFMAPAAILMAVSPALSAPTCIDTRDIKSTSSKEGKVLTIAMRDGTVLQNNLQGICSDLKFSGFTWVLRSGDRKVCEGQQTIKVIKSGQICVLGKFSPASTPKPASR